jgi:hypothetical protein
MAPVTPPESTPQSIGLELLRTLNSASDKTDSYSQQVSKLDAAAAMLDRAIQLFIDQHDYLSAVVLAGSSEEVCADLMTTHGQVRKLPEGHKKPRPVRSIIARWAARMGNTQSESEFHKLDKFFFDWLRHANRKNDPMEVSVDLLREAEHRIASAVANYFHVTGSQTNQMQRWNMREGAEPYHPEFRRGLISAPSTASFCSAKQEIGRQQRQNVTVGCSCGIELHTAIRSTESGRD